MNTKTKKYGMLALLAVLLIGVVLISGCIDEEKVKSEGNQTNVQTTNNEDYFPLSVGNSWSYDFNVKSGETNIQKTMDVKISKKEKIDSVETYVMEYKVNNKVSQTEYYAKNDKKVMCYRRILYGTEYNFKPPEVLYDFSGEKWESNKEINGGYMSLKGETIGEETITVPAGTFKTYKVKMIIRDGNGRILTSVNRWFAQGVGMVKEESIDEKFDKQVFVSVELKEYRVNK